MKPLYSLSIVALFVIAAALNTARADDFQPDPGYVSLFNGRDLTGWAYRMNGQTNSFDGKAESTAPTMVFLSSIPGLRAN